MIGLILNSGLGTRLGKLTANNPKCLVELADGETILARQLRLLWDQGVNDFVVTTGPYTTPIEKAARAAVPHATFEFVNNPDYASTNYIYSIYLAKRALEGEEIVSLHGDLVFDAEAAKVMAHTTKSCVAVDSAEPLPEKDFKATLDPQGRIISIGIDVWDEPVISLQPFYHLNVQEWDAWLEAICEFCERGDRTVYAENAFNANYQDIEIWPEDLKGALCREVDTVSDLQNINKYINRSNRDQCVLKYEH